MSQIQTTKLLGYVGIGVPAANVGVSKLVAYVIAFPGEGGPDTSGRQGHVHTQIIRRR